jgi:ComF family protein
MRGVLRAALSIIGREALRIVLPSVCAGCGEELPWRDRISSCCGPCWRSLPRIESAKCVSCALPLPGGTQCITCSTDPLPLTWCEAWGEYRASLERLLHAFKFQRHDFLAGRLASLLEETIRERDDVAFDAIAAVPMHPAKRRRRGYNQAELLAAALSKRVAIPFDRRLLTKRAERETQSTLARAARAANVRGVYEASQRAEEKSILLVDDICTTGETFRACARELLRAGATRVCAISVAKAT